MLGMLVMTWLLFVFVFVQGSRPLFHEQSHGSTAGSISNGKRDRLQAITFDSGSIDLELGIRMKASESFVMNFPSHVQEGHKYWEHGRN